MGSFWWERVIHKKHHGINEIFGNIKHYLKLKKKKIWGSQLRLKAQPPCWFFAPRLTWPVFFSTYSFFFFFFKQLQSTSLNLKWALVRRILKLQGCASSCRVCAITGAHCKGEHSHPPAHSFTKATHTGASCETWLTGKLHTFSAAHRKHTAQTSTRHMQGSLGLEKPWSLGSEAADPLHIPGFSSPTTPRLCQHTCLYGHMVNKAKEMKVPGLFYRHSNYVSLYIYYGTFLLAFGTLLFACWVLSPHMIAQQYS